MTDENVDGLGALSEMLAIRRSGWHRQENPETGAVAILPTAAKNEFEWEQRAVAMHGDQKTITLEAKPVENNMARARIARGD